MMRSLSVLLLCFLHVLVSAQQREYVIVVHGGAGAISAIANDPVLSAACHCALDTALQKGADVLDSGGQGSEAVIAAINYLENNPLFNSGKGATVNAEGFFELDASFMRGSDLNAGAVAGVRTIKNPINAAYAVMTETPHVLLSGAGADRFAKAHGIETVDDNRYFATPETLQQIEEMKKENKKNGTVGCVVLDKYGNLFAGTSTGGMFKKMPGRIGDSPIIGAGTYADNNSCAVSCTGHGEFFIRHVVAFHLCVRYKYLGETVEEAANHIIHKELNANAGNGGLIAVDKNGQIAMTYNSQGMFRGFLFKEKNNAQVVKKIGIGDRID